MSIDFATLILNETPDAVIVTSAHGDVLCWSEGAQAVFGYTEGEARGQLLADLINPPGAPGHGSAVAPCGASYEAVRRAKDGSLIHIEGLRKAVRDGQSDLILWSKRDVTERKVRRQGALFEARFRDLLGMTPDATLVADAAGRVVLANARAERLFGGAPGALRGMALAALLPGAHGVARAGAQSGERLRAQARRCDGALFMADLVAHTVEGAEGALQVCAVRSEAMHGATPSATHSAIPAPGPAATATRGGEPQAARARATDTIAHQLRTPLNAILGFTGTLLMRLPGPLNADQERQLKTIERSARQVLALADALFELRQLDAGACELNPEALVCQDLIGDIGAAFLPQLRSKGLQLILDCPAEPITITVDHGALRQLLVRLVGNAIKFTAAGQVRLTLAQCALEDEAGVAFRVSDTGIGIDAARLDALFDAVAPSADGAGLGLHVSKKLATLLRGKIECASQPGAGSVFTLVLPAACTV
ncbi:MAG: PAS domain-containing sensor histidine kinase [Pseudomonadota bacterium]